MASSMGWMKPSSHASTPRQATSNGRADGTATGSSCSQRDTCWLSPKRASWRSCVRRLSVTSRLRASRPSGARPGTIPRSLTGISSYATEARWRRSISGSSPRANPLLPNDDAALHHEPDVLHRAQVVQWIAGNGYDIGESSLLEHADVASEPDSLGGVDRRRANCVCLAEADGFELQEFICVASVGNHPRVRSKRERQPIANGSRHVRTKLLVERRWVRALEGPQRRQLPDSTALHRRDRLR